MLEVTGSLCVLAFSFQGEDSEAGSKHGLPGRAHGPCKQGRFGFVQRCCGWSLEPAGLLRAELRNHINGFSLVDDLQGWGGTLCDFSNRGKT